MGQRAVALPLWNDHIYDQLPILANIVDLFFLEFPAVCVQSRAWMPIGCVAAENIFNAMSDVASHEVYADDTNYI